MPVKANVAERWEVGSRRTVSSKFPVGVTLAMQGLERRVPV